MSELPSRNSLLQDLSWNAYVFYDELLIVFRSRKQSDKWMVSVMQSDWNSFCLDVVSDCGWRQHFWQNTKSQYVKIIKISYALWNWRKRINKVCITALYNKELTKLGLSATTTCNFVYYSKYQNNHNKNPKTFAYSVLMMFSSLNATLTLSKTTLPQKPIWFRPTGPLVAPTNRSDSVRLDHWLHLQMLHKPHA